MRTPPSRRSRVPRDRWLTKFGPDQTQHGMETGLIPEAVGPMQAFVTTARDNPRVLRISSQIGTVEPGKLADPIAVDIDPLSCPGLLNTAPPTSGSSSKSATARRNGGDGCERQRDPPGQVSSLVHWRGLPSPTGGCPGSGRAR